MEGEAQLVPHYGWWLNVRSPGTIPKSPSSTTDASHLCSAGIAGINKTIAIASITQTSDITYAIYALNTWVLTEMWFIIIFGSIPVLRLLFIRFTQSTKTSASYPFDQGQRSGPHMHLSRSTNDTWVQLGDRAETHATYDPSSKRAYTAESEEDILPDRTGDGHIMVTRETQVKREDHL